MEILDPELGCSHKKMMGKPISKTQKIEEEILCLEPEVVLKCKMTGVPKEEGGGEVF